MLKSKKNSKSLLIALNNCWRSRALIWIFLFTQSTTIFESSNTCNWEILMFIAKSRAVCRTASSALLVQCLGAYFACTLCLSEKYITPLEPPKGGSPWLAPSKKAQGTALFIYGGTNILFLGSFSFDLCSLIHCTTRAIVTSRGIYLLLMIAIFRAHQIPYAKKEGSALNKHTDLQAHQP